MNDPIRIGAVEYVNARPLIWGLKEKLPQGSLILDKPAVIADMLREGRLDVALIPSIEYLRNPDYSIVPDICICSRGPVMSVILICLKPTADIGRVALDNSSRSSAALCRIILQKQFEIEPEYVEWNNNDPVDEAHADAFLVIGDRAMRLRSEYENVIDLGAAWYDLTGLPFVYAIWAGCNIDQQVIRLLKEARRQGGCHLARIACRAAAELHLPESFCIEYLSFIIRYELGQDEQQGLKLFQEYASQLGLCPAREERRALVFA